MKKTILLLGTMLLGAVPSMAWQGDVKVETPNMLMLLTAQEGQDLRMAYFGARTATLQEVCDAGDDVNFPALPAFGSVDMIHLPAIQVQHANGDQNLELSVERLESRDEANAKVHIVTMKDKLLPVTVRPQRQAVYRQVPHECGHRSSTMGGLRVESI